MKYMFGWDPETKSGILTFVGATIGGVITYLGVIETINFRVKKERYNRLPQLINDGWKIKRAMSFTSFLSIEIKRNVEIDDVKIVEEYYNENEEWVTELAAKIDPKLYDVVNRFFTLISDYSVYKRRKHLSEWFSKAYEMNNEVSEIIDSFEKEYRKGL